MKKNRCFSSVAELTWTIFITVKNKKLFSLWLTTVTIVLDFMLIENINQIKCCLIWVMYGNNQFMIWFWNSSVKLTNTLSTLNRNPNFATWLIYFLLFHCFDVFIGKSTNCKVTVVKYFSLPGVSVHMFFLLVGWFFVSSLQAA